MHYSSLLYMSIYHHFVPVFYGHERAIEICLSHRNDGNQGRFRWWLMSGSQSFFSYNHSDLTVLFPMELWEYERKTFNMIETTRIDGIIEG